MPLKLVTGPANSGKAGELLRAYRARLADDPILVVPRAEDVDHTRRELAEGGAALGVRVVRFSGLFELIARRVEPELAVAPRARGLRRELLVEEAVRRTPLKTMAGSARRPGFARAAGRFVAELGRSMVDPARLRRALRAWAGEGPRRAYAEDIAALYAAYHEALAEAGLLDDELFARRSLDALRRARRRFGRTPVFVYGFDDLTALELDALETLARHAGAEVTVSLPFERGRVAFRATAASFALLSELADEHVELPASADHYAPQARATLGRLERRLFEPGGGDGEAMPEGPLEPLRLHLAGGRRAEVELAGAAVLRALEEGTAPGEIAVVVREPAGYASLIEEVFDAYEIPFSIERSIPLVHTALGRGVVGLLRCAAGSGSAGDLVAYLRTPGRVRSTGLVDRLEADARRAGVADADGARRLWEHRGWALEEIDRLRAAAGGPHLLEVLDGHLERLFAGPYARRGHLLSGPEREDAAVLRTARGALADVGALTSRGLGPPLEPAALADLLGAVPARLGEPHGAERVRVDSPEAVRARRFDVVLVLGLQEGEFPRRPVSEPFLSDELRREVSLAAGLSLPIREDELDRERHLFYACASRAERRLVLSSRLTDEQGAAEAPSFFLEDVRELFPADVLDEAAARRTLADVTWAPEAAPTALERERALAAAGPRLPGSPPAPLRDEALIAELAAREEFSAGELEAFAECPVKWLVERLVRPEGLEPDPERLVRGRYAHAVLERTLAGLRERTGSARVTPETLGEAESILAESLEQLAGEHRISAGEGRLAAARRRLELDLLAHLRREAAAGGSFEPTHLELGFGLTAGEPQADGAALPALALEPGIRIRGRIDRVDTLGDRAIVRDYKGGRRASGIDRWEEEDRLQAPLYMLAARELLGLEPAGGLYVPLAGKGRPRGVVCADDAEAVGERPNGPDVREAGAVDAALASARARAREVVGRLRRGEVEPCPARCAPNGGCSYPSVCREERG